MGRVFLFSPLFYLPPILNTPAQSPLPRQSSSLHAPKLTFIRKKKEEMLRTLASKSACLARPAVAGMRNGTLAMAGVSRGAASAAAAAPAVRVTGLGECRRNGEGGGGELGGCEAPAKKTGGHKKKKKKKKSAGSPLSPKSPPLSHPSTQLRPSSRPPPSPPRSPPPTTPTTRPGRSPSATLKSTTPRPAAAAAATRPPRPRGGSLSSRASPPAGSAWPCPPSSASSRARSSKR